jgi:hypothetical protein
MFILISPVSELKQQRTITTSFEGSSAPKFQPTERQERLKAAFAVLDSSNADKLIGNQRRATAEARQMLTGGAPEIVQKTATESKNTKGTDETTGTPKSKGGNPNNRTGKSDGSSGGGNNDGTKETTGSSKNMEILGAVGGAVLSAIGFGLTQMKREEWGMGGHAIRYLSAIAFMFFSMFGLGKALETQAPIGALGSEAPM